ncbi:MAG: late competence development ComFB family protein [Syntrophomonadaceae bacterium]|mgnify:CR=1 FL=1|nr:late competence development ComFB family protein [Syntrophomonadaceae bacterium]
MGVFNVMEKMVSDSIERVLREYPDSCQCEKCRDDIAAFALNQLKPKYATTHKGEIISKAQCLETQYSLDVITALTLAVERVSRQPRHE